MSRYTSPSLPALRVVLSALVLVLVLVLLPACAKNSAPAASVQTTSGELVTSPSRTAAYEFPPGAPRGEVRVATLGLTRPPATQKRTLHARMTVTNQSDEPWTIRQSEQRVELPTQEQLFPTTDTGGAVPVVEVPPRTTSTLDLYFQLPPRLQSTREMEPFAFVWTIRAGALPFTLHSPFEGFPASDVDTTTPAPADPFGTPQAPEGAPSAGPP